MANRACNQHGKRSTSDFVNLIIIVRLTERVIQTMYIYLGWLLRPRKKRRILRNALICAICHYYAYSFTGRGGKKHISKGNCMGRLVIITTVTQQQSSFTYLQRRRRRRMLLIEIIMRPVGEFMGHPVIIRSLKPTNNLLSPRSWRWRGWGWGWWGCGWYWQCRCASDGCPIIRSLSRAKTFSPVSIFHKHNYNEDLVARWQNCFSFSVF